tara:strand:+ start:158 stop:391 length:234 start_codon:yes stop_codon:yes gene_type:complete
MKQMRFLIFLSFFLISCGSGTENAPIKDNSANFDENSLQDSTLQDLTSINKSISTSGEEDNIANIFGSCMFGDCKFE